LFFSSLFVFSKVQQILPLITFLHTSWIQSFFNSLSSPLCSFASIHISNCDALCN
jgi:hypothetical protein